MRCFSKFKVLNIFIFFNYTFDRHKSLSFVFPLRANRKIVIEYVFVLFILCVSHTFSSSHILQCVLNIKIKFKYPDKLKYILYL